MFSPLRIGGGQPCRDQARQPKRAMPGRNASWTRQPDSRILGATGRRRHGKLQAARRAVPLDAADGTLVSVSSPEGKLGSWKN